MTAAVDLPRGSTSFKRSLNERRSTRLGMPAVSSFCQQSCREWTKKPLSVPSRTIFGNAPGVPAVPAITLRVQPFAAES